MKFKKLESYMETMPTFYEKKIIKSNIQSDKKWPYRAVKFWLKMNPLFLALQHPLPSVSIALKSTTISQPEWFTTESMRVACSH